MARWHEFDVIVCGLGINGAAALYYLSKIPNLRVLGIESKKPAHEKCGSYGQTRLLRRSYFEDFEYVPLVTESLKLWWELQLTCTGLLIKNTGLTFLGPTGNNIFDKIRQCTSQFALPIEEISVACARRRFPYLGLPDHFQIFFEHEACVLFPESLIAHFLEEAVRNKNITTTIRNPVQAISPNGDPILISTFNGNFAAKKVLVTAGGWTQFLLPDLGLPIKIRESPQFWFQEDSISAVTSPFAVSLDNNEFIYGFPDFGMGLKMASYHPGRFLKSPDERSNSTHGLSAIQSCIKNHFPHVQKTPKHQHTCFFDMGPNENLILDFHPQNKNLVYLAAGSGHGLKMAPALALSAIEMIKTQQYVQRTYFLNLKARDLSP